MTVISAVINRRCIAVASDSLITYEEGNTRIVLERKKPKIVKVESKKAILSYWGYAATTAKMRGWTTYDFLKKIAKDAYQFESLKLFADYIKEQLNKDVGVKLEYDKKGIGIHLIGYTEVKGEYIPEFYLISNFRITNKSYQVEPQLRVSSELYKTLPKSYRKWLHPTNENKVNAIKTFLNEGKMFIFNNGDPFMFNPVFNGYRKSYRIAKERGILDNNEIERARFLAREPIVCVVNAQKVLFREGSKIVGGRVHDITLEKDTFNYHSSSKSAKIE